MNCPNSSTLTDAFSEEDLVNSFIKFLESENSPWGKIKFVREFFYSRGRTDVVAITEDLKIVAFEAKLDKWKEAVHQAYRNTCFAHESYVVLPQRRVNSMRIYENEFDKRGVGLCSVDAFSIQVIKPARQVNPIQNWLTQKAIDTLKV
jgi:hypothetical protein